MIFKVEHTAGDTCGNEWVEGEPEYLEAKSLEDAWKKLKKSDVHTYCLEGKWIYFLTNEEVRNGPFLAHKENPDFNWGKDKKKATGFKSGGFNGIQVTLIKVRR